MTDKEKFRKEVEKLKSNLIHGACSSQVAMETRCKEEAYNEILAILDSMQEEPVSEDLETFAKKESEAFAEREYEIGYFDRNALGKGYYWGCVDGANWQKEHLMKDAVDGEIGYWNLRWLSVNADLPRTVEEGDKVKVILIKEK